MTLRHLVLSLSHRETRVRRSFVLQWGVYFSSLLSPTSFFFNFFFKKIWHTFQQLEKFVNLNYQAFEKLLKNHDKLLPATPCHQFYMAKLRNQVFNLYTYMFVYKYV